MRQSTSRAQTRLGSAPVTGWYPQVCFPHWMPGWRYSNTSERACWRLFLGPARIEALTEPTTPVHASLMVQMVSASESSADVTCDPRYLSTPAPIPAHATAQLRPVVSVRTEDLCSGPKQTWRYSSRSNTHRLSESWSNA